MSDTPQTLVDDFIVNTTGSPKAPQVVTLSNGNLLVAYSTATGGPGNHIRGQVFDPNGSPIGDGILFEFPHEINVSRFDIAALPGGQVAIATEAKPFFAEVMARRFRIDEEGKAEFAGSQFVDFFSGAGSHFIKPTVTGIDEDSYRLFFVEDEDLGRIDLKFDGMDGGQQVIGGNQNTKSVKKIRGGDEATVDSDTLSNGNMVVVLDKDGDGRHGDLHYFVIRPDGSKVREGKTGNGREETHDARVSALKDGGFVITWTEDDGNDFDIYFRMYDANGNPTTGVTSHGGTPGRSDENDEPVVTALEDGGFILFYDKNKGDDEIRGQRFDRDGNKVGEDFLVFQGRASKIEATTLPDGRVAVSFQVTGGDVKVEILTVDSDNLIPGTDGNDSLTGTEEDDLISGDVGDDSIDGGDGDDEILGGVGEDKIDGGRGNDQIFAGRGDDQIDGGSGHDSIEGGDGDDQITGGLGGDSIDGGAGNDWIRGNGSGDIIDGGSGDDTIFGDGGSDVIEGGDGNDLLFGGLGSDTFVFNDRNDANEIGDFDAGDDNEVIDLRGLSAITDFADLSDNHMRQEEDDVVIDDGAGTTITLKAVNIADLDANDFIF